MASPQKENGFTPIAHEILEQVAKRKFNATQHSILLIVWRMTYGFSRQDHELAVNYFVKQTGFTKRNIQESLSHLLECGVLVETQKASFNKTRKIAFNKNYDEWKITCRTKSKQVKKNSPHEEEFTSTGEEENTSTGEESFTQERNNKEIYKEIEKQVPLKEIESKEKPSGKAGVLVKILNEKFPERKRFGVKGNIAANDEFTKFLESGKSAERLLITIQGLEEELPPWDIVRLASEEIKTESQVEAERVRHLKDVYELGEEYFEQFGDIEEYHDAVKELRQIGQL